MLQRVPAKEALESYQAKELYAPKLVVSAHRRLVVQQAFVF